MNPTYETLLLNTEKNVAHLQFNNPKMANAMTSAFWKELKEAMYVCDENPEVRVVVISGGESKHFSSGIDLAMLMGMKNSLDKLECEGRAREQLRRNILNLQETFTSIERCRKPVMAAIHGACIGGGVDLISACDMRYCTEDAYFCVREIDIGMVADVGTMQRLPKIISEGIARELAYTGRNVNGTEAKEIHLVNQCYDHRDTMMREVMMIAETIASKSPLSIRGTKEMLLYTRDHSVEEGLNYIATWNAGMLFSKDIQDALSAYMQKKKAEFVN